ncbi:LacI family DNA-binding transcriptional regulator [Nakamurella sp. YIM 132087]|uniref:LacI family DNA-binding transcriptional regulator n=1 Tax=Nakamurella alba TaxID=2665158 RepID=A0A7K1FN71_9ACTN|nr:LacI family DNA-binding transcriptional regulator [Nakamurella alba]MTD15617.1 LacI family DNA-binding transcriptional regulator [Nakamurella alba]
MSTTRATVYDVARLSGVSIKTVSRVVNGSLQVSETTRAKVLDAVAELGYVRNPIAHSLRTGSSDTIGVVVDSISDHFFSALVSVVEERALAKGFSVLIGSTGRDPGRERGQVQRMLQQNVAGLLLAPNTSDHSYLLGTAGDLPMVLIDRGWELPGFDTVGVQDHSGGYAATQHLLRHGHRRIAFLGEDIRLETITHRRSGYHDALADAGVPLDESLIRTDCSEAPIAALATLELLTQPNPPTAIFSSNPRASLGSVSALHRAGRTDVAFVSFGDFDLADALSPAISIIDQDPTPIAVAAADRLLDRMAGESGPAQQIVLPITLIERGSGEIAP